MKLTNVAIGVAALVSVSVFSAETDQFTKRNEYLKDSSTIINLKANKAILEAVNLANAKDSTCNEEALYKELRKYFANHMSGKLTIDILSDPQIEKRAFEFKDSVYRDWSPWDGAGMGFSLFTTSTMSGVVRMGEQTIGVDKFEHMFGQGFAYFTSIYLKDKKAEKALKGGIFREKFFLGGLKLGNGVFSYGDLGANFNGMRMWNHMLQLRDDVLGSEFNIGPYIACENSKWVQVKDIDFTSYIDDSMDEAINCSKFPTQKTTDKFKERLRLMGMSCPMDENRLDDLIIKYKHMSKWIINEEGAARVKYTSEFTHKEEKQTERLNKRNKNPRN